jgi:hypothetical protein
MNDFESIPYIGLERASPLAFEVLVRLFLLRGM